MSVSNLPGLSAILLVILLCLVSPSFLHAKSARSQEKDSFHVLHVRLKGRFDAGNCYAVKSALDMADGSPKYDLVLFDANLSGGDLFYTLSAFDRIKRANTPVVVYVNRTIQSIPSILPFAASSIYFHPEGNIKPGELDPAYTAPAGSSRRFSKESSTLRDLYIERLRERGHSRAIAKFLFDPSFPKLPVRTGNRVKFVSPNELERANNDNDRNEALLSDPDVDISSSGLNAELARSLHLSSGTFLQKKELLRWLTESRTGGDVFVHRNTSDTGTTLVNFFSWHAGILLLLSPGLGFLWFEFTQPGVGLAGFLSALFLFSFFVVRGLTGFVGILEYMLIVCGLVFLVIEKFIFPGFGRAGILGTTCLLLAALLSLQPFVLPGGILYERELSLMFTNTVRILIGCGIGLLIFYLLFRYLSPKLEPRFYIS